jgi:hypothetical protein
MRRKESDVNLEEHRGCENNVSTGVAVDVAAILQDCLSHSVDLPLPLPWHGDDVSCSASKRAVSMLAAVQQPTTPILPPHITQHPPRDASS